jgi:septum site-determining protein MinD
VISDSPAGIETESTLAMQHADATVVVVNSEVSSIRDADRIVGMLDAKTARAKQGHRF